MPSLSIFLSQPSWQRRMASADSPHTAPFLLCEHLSLLWLGRAWAISGLMAIPQVFDPIAMPGQRRFQVIELFRQNAFHQIGGDGLLASLVADVQSERQVQLNLQRGAELGARRSIASAVRMVCGATVLSVQASSSQGCTARSRRPSMRQSQGIKIHEVTQIQQGRLHSPLT
jgi:hypothetical protein